MELRSINQLVIASENRGKLEEFQRLGKEFALEIVPLHQWVRNANFLATVEKSSPGTSYIDNARHKCVAAFGAAKVPTFADDSGLEVLGLDRKPGILSARWVDPKAGQSRDAAAREKILHSLKGKAEKDRDARFVCSLVFMVEGVMITTEGVCEGKIAVAERGTHGFGYDSIFIPKAGDGRTLAEMSMEEKNKFSHRAIAFRELMKKIKEEDIRFVRP